MTPHEESYEEPTRDEASEGASSNAEATRAPRATKAEVAGRVAAVRRWITDEGVAVEEALERLQDEHGIGRRQALRYWVRGYLPLLSDEDRRRWDRPRDRQGRYQPWPSLQRRKVSA